MFAEENFHNKSEQKPKISISKASFVLSVIGSFKHTVPAFLAHIQSLSKADLNEEELTQEFVALLRRKLINLEYPFTVGQEKKDVYHGSKGRVDFYFYPIDETTSTESLFDVEAKKLPTPLPKQREKEYVIGTNQNGGIERYKIEKHGKGLNECGILGFVENKDFPYWETVINQWIIEQSQSDIRWKDDEQLHIVETQGNYSYLNSVAHRITGTDLILHHFWVKIK